MVGRSTRTGVEASPTGDTGGPIGNWSPKQTPLSTVKSRLSVGSFENLVRDDLKADLVRWYPEGGHSPKDAITCWWFDDGALKGGRSRRCYPGATGPKECFHDESYPGLDFRDGFPLHCGGG